jgi:hypothetical protein
MNNTENSNNRPGGTIDSWCGKCKMMLAHTIEAMVGVKPARVHCNTCNAQHTYKAHAPSTAPRQVRAREPGAAAPATPRTRVSRYQALLKGKESAVARIYSMKEKYEAGDVLEHPHFGRGVTTAVKDATKIEVLFDGGSKVLIHGQ